MLHCSPECGELPSPRRRREGRLKEADVFTVMMLRIGLALLIAGCDGSKPAVPSHELAGTFPDSQPRAGPVIHSAAIIPTPVTRNGPLKVYVEDKAQHQSPVTILYQWIVNDAPVPGATNPTFPATQLKRGDRVQVDLIPFDVTGQGAPYHVAAETVGNSPPVIKAIAVEPTDVRVNTSLQAHADVVDVDFDRVQVTFRWWRNNQVVKEGDDAVLDTAGFRAGDVIVVEATPADPEGAGQTVRSEPVMIQNSPPTVTTTPPPPTNLERYEYAVRATDPDGDPIRFSLVSAPLGMTIGENSGLIIWRIPPGLKGTHNAQIAIEDNRGGSAVQNIELTLPAPAES